MNLFTLREIKSSPFISASIDRRRAVYRTEHPSELAETILSEIQEWRPASISRNPSEPNESYDKDNARAWTDVITLITHAL